MQLFDARMSLQLYAGLERHMNSASRPLVLPDWLEPSEVSYAATRVGAVEHRGETIKADTDIRGQEGTP